MQLSYRGLQCEHILVLVRHILVGVADGVGSFSLHSSISSIISRDGGKDINIYSSIVSVYDHVL